MTTGQFHKPPREFWSLPFGKPLSPFRCTPPELGACEQFDWSLALHPGWCVFGQNGFTPDAFFAELRRPDCTWRGLYDPPGPPRLAGVHVIDLDAVRREISRCKGAVATGSPRAFWTRRLQKAARELRAALALIERQLVDLGEIERPST